MKINHLLSLLKHLLQLFYLKKQQALKKVLVHQTLLKWQLLPEPFSTPAAFLSKIAAGGVLVTKVNDLSSYTEITTGMIIPAWSAVRALNSFVKPMMLTPA